MPSASRLATVVVAMLALFCSSLASTTTRVKANLLLLVVSSSRAVMGALPVG